MPNITTERLLDYISQKVVDMDKYNTYARMNGIEWVENIDYRTYHLLIAWIREYDNAKETPRERVPDTVIKAAKPKSDKDKDNMALQEPDIYL